MRSVCPELPQSSQTSGTGRDRAGKIHRDVNQFYEFKPYAYHLNQVAACVTRYLSSVLSDEEDILPVLFAAYFHDSIEDARLTYNDVRKIASEYMEQEQAFLAAEIVYALTNEKGRNRKERANDKYYEGIRTTPYAPLVKACDRLANYSYAKARCATAATAPSCCARRRGSGSWASA